MGGVAALMQQKTEGYVYQPAAAYMLAYYIKQIFAAEEKAAAMGCAARHHAEKTHDPEMNLQTLLAVYRQLSEEA